MSGPGRGAGRLPGGQPFRYTKRPEPTWAKVLGVVVLVGGVVVTLIVVGVAWMVWSLLGGAAHTATDSAVTAARLRGRPQLRRTLSGW